MATVPSKLFPIFAAVSNTLADDLGNNDFSATGAVQVGRFPTPPAYPFIAVDLENMQSDDDVTMGLFEHTVGFYIEAWGASTTDKLVNSMLASINLAHDIQRAIHEAHRTAGGALKAQSVRRANFPDLEFMNTEIQGKKVGHVRMRLELTYTTDGGI